MKSREASGSLPHRGPESSVSITSDPIRLATSASDRTANRAASSPKAVPQCATLAEPIRPTWWRRRHWHGQPGDGEPLKL